MNGRNYIARRVRLLGLFPLPLMLIAFFLFCCSSWDFSIFWVSILVFLVAIIFMFLISARVVCPFCKSWIAPILSFDHNPFVRGLPKKIKHCPICGTNFDTELKEESANKGMNGTR